MINEKILKKSQAIKNELIRIRRDIHAHPEHGYEEYRTAKLIAKELKDLDIKVIENIGGTGVIGLLEGKKPGKTVMLRADMDCLYMDELNDFKFKSKYEGRMHACGHDGHVAWLLGAAMILSELRDELNGCVKFLFQPAEEGLAGALKTIEDGVLKNPKVDAVFGAHVWPSLESGTIGVRNHTVMSGMSKFKIIIKGKGGHGAEPHKTNDPISIACQVYMSLQNYVSRKTDPTDPLVLAITTINGGTAHNIIPDFVEMTGTIRYVSEEMRENIPHKLESIIKGVTGAHEGDYEFEYNQMFQPVINSVDTTNLVREVATKALGETNVIEMLNPTMTSEDFSFFQQKVPGTFFMVGIRNEEKGIIQPLHNSCFNIDEDVLPVASALFSELAIAYLKQ